MKWFIELQGSDREMDILSRLSEPYKIEHVGGKSYLTSDQFTDLNDASILREKGEQMVNLLNGALAISGVPPIQITGIGHVDDANNRQFHHQTSLEMRARIVPADWNASAEEDLRSEVATYVGKRMSLAATSEAVSSVLQMLSVAYINWGELYKVIELINDDADIVKSGWTSRKKFSDFRHSANDPRSAGKDSRHAVPNSTEAPKNPMSREEANSYVRHIASCWISSKT